MKPSDIRLKKPLDLEHMTEYEYANHIRLLGRTNKVYKSYIVPGNSKKYFENQDGTLLTHHTKQKLHRKTGSNFKFPTTVIELTGMEVPMHHY
jgi:glycine dehydrogenase